MKKKLILLVICAVFLFSTQVFADSLSLIGKKVAGESSITLNGVEIKSAIIVNNSAYAPVRDLVESLGGEVEFKKTEKGSAIKVTSPETKEVTKEMVWKKAGIEANIISANNEIERSNQTIESSNKKLETEKNEELISFYQNMITEAQQQIIKAQQDIITYTNELLELESAK